MFDNISGVTFEPVIFTKAKTAIPGVRAEYYKHPDGVKFHFWGEPKFPEEFGDNLKTAFVGFPEENIIIEYVPEVESWYGEIKKLSTLTDSLVERLVSKISMAVERNGKE